MRFAVSIFALLTTGSAMASDFNGTYALNDDWDCVNIGSDGGAIQIVGNDLHGIESFCQLSNPISVRGMSATLYDESCESEGTQVSQRVMFMRSQNTVGSIFIVRDGIATEWYACP